MENMMMRLRNQQHTHPSCIAKSHTPSLAMHKDSHMVAKAKPKIRIIHIFAPEIIKTDVENFRELVQKLTGKPGGEKCFNIKKKARVNVVPKREGEHSRRSSTSGSGMSEDNTLMMKTVKSNDNNLWGLDVMMTRDPHKVKEEFGICCSDQSYAGGYLGGFSDLEGFISEIGGFPLLPMDGNNHMMIHGFEEPQLL